MKINFNFLNRIRTACYLLVLASTAFANYLMEDNDDYEPDDAGNLELRYCGWTDIEPRLWNFSHCLISLDVSFNRLAEIPGEISRLHLLQELNCACNKLTSLPGSLALLGWLRVLKANGNGLRAVPTEIGGCKALEVLNLSENALTSVPGEIAGCARLHTLLLQNNALPRLPLSLAALAGKIQQLDVSNNSHELLTTLPAEIHRDVDSIMWIVALQQDKGHDIERLKQEIKGTKRDNIDMERELAKARERILLLEEKKRVLDSDMESIQYFLAARSHCREWRRRCLRWWQEGKAACARKT